MVYLSLKSCHYIRQVIIIVIYCITSIKMECNVCQENQAACINSTSFYLCFGENLPYTEKLYHCKDGFACTKFNAICVQSNNMYPPSCGDTSLCGQCSANRNYVFACLSRTTFQMCYGGIHPTDQIGYCPPGTVCDANNDAICVSTAEKHTITCDIVAGGTGKPSTTTEKTPHTMTPNEVCAEMREVGLFPTIPQDPFCRRYIHCHYSNSVILGTEYMCSANSYYNMETEACTFKKPSYCI